VSKLEIVRDMLRVGRVELWFDGGRCPGAPEEIAASISRASLSPDAELTEVGVPVEFRGIPYDVPWEAVFQATPSAIVWADDYPTDRAGPIPRVERCKVQVLSCVPVVDAPEPRHLKLVE
jgi:hypothetical protein